MYIQKKSKKSLSTRKRHVIYIQTKTEVSDGEGGFSEVWANSPVTSVWASIEPLSAHKVFDYSSVGVDATHEISIDGVIDISESSRILFGSRVFEIVTVEDFQERNFEKVIICRERR